MDTRTSDSPDPLLPQLVRSRVGIARRGLLSVRWLQGLCLGLGAAVIALALGLPGQAGFFSSGLFLVAGINGLLVFLLWGLFHRRSAARVAREVDRAMGMKGALFTAWEVEGQGQATEIARRLGTVVAGQAPSGQMLRAVLPTTLPLLAVPFAAFAILFAVMENTRRHPRGADLQGLAQEMRAGIGAVNPGDAGPADGKGQSLSALERQQLQQILRETAALGDDLEQGEASSERLESMVERLGRVDERWRSNMSERQREGLDRARTALDAARMSIESSGSDGGVTGLNANSPGDSEGSSGRGLAPDGIDGRMGGQNPPPPRAPQPNQPGVLGSPSWPKAYDGIVQRWVESVRQ